MRMLPRPAVNLCVTVIPVHIREHPAFPAFQVRTDAFRNSAQLFASTFFRYPGLSVFDPCIEVKMWIPRFHWFVSFSKGSHLPGARDLLGPQGCWSLEGAPLRQEAVEKANETAEQFIKDFWRTRWGLMVKREFCQRSSSIRVRAWPCANGIREPRT